MNGECLCGSVKVSFNPKAEIFDACHCSMCRKWGGGPALTVEAGSEMKLMGEESIVRYQSSDWAERAFCKNCGTHLFYHLKGSEMYNFPLGLLSDTEKLKFHVQIFVDHKATNYNFAEKTEMMTEAEVLAKFAGN